MVNESRGARQRRASRQQRRSGRGAGRSCLRRPQPRRASEQKSAYDASAQRLEDLVRAQNPAVGAQPPVGFEHLVQQFYVSAMIQMGAGHAGGSASAGGHSGRAHTIDLLGVLAEKTKGNLTEAEDRTLQSVLFEVRMAFLELTSMMTVPSVPPPAAAEGAEQP